MAAFFPGQVNLRLAKTLLPTKVTMAEIGGYLGDPAKFDAVKAKKDAEESCRMMAEAIAGFLKKTD